MSTLAEFRTQVRQALKDTGSITWTDADLDQHIRQSLNAYNRIDPVRAAATLATVDGQRSYSLTAVAGLITILDVVHPYTPANPAHPPARPSWSILEGNTLYLEDGDTPNGVASIRLTYTKPHTIQNLDGAAATTLMPHANDLIVLGATALAAEQIAQSVIGTATISGWTPRHFHDWAVARRAAWNSALEQLTNQLRIAHDPRVAWEDATL